MLPYCQEGILLFLYTFLAFGINLFLLKILLKNFQKIEILFKYKNVLKLYKKDFFHFYFLEFFDKKDLLQIKIKDLIIFSKKGSFLNGFYSKLLKFVFK